MDDCGRIDVKVSCEDAFSHPLFRNYVDFQHTVGTDIISPVGEKTYEVVYDGTNVTLYVNYNDKGLTVDTDLVDGFDFFEAYHEHWAFLPLPSAPSEDETGCRRVAGDDRRDDMKSGCRLFHSFIAIFGEDAPVTKDEWYAATDEEAMTVRGFVESGTYKE